MEKQAYQQAPSRQTGSRVIFAAFEILKAAGGHLPGREVIDKIRKSITFTEWEKQIHEKTSYIRWESILHFFTVDCSKAGYLRKNKGIWYLTEEGEKAMTLGPINLLDSATKGYRQWVAENKQNKTENPREQLTAPEVENIKQEQKANLEIIEEQAITGIKEFIKAKNPYDFQDLVAALLRAMKYYTPFISPKGKDGGLDIVAYSDPLGASGPRLKVQVKHRPESSVPVDDIRGLIGLLNKDGDIGVFVTSGYFTSESERAARDSHKHIKLIDIDAFINLWQEFYTFLKDEDKNLLPLQSIYFLGSTE